MEDGTTVDGHLSGRSPSGTNRDSRREHIGVVCLTWTSCRSFVSWSDTEVSSGTLNVPSCLSVPCTPMSFLLKFFSYYEYFVNNSWLTDESWNVKNFPSLNNSGCRTVTPVTLNLTHRKVSESMTPCLTPITWVRQTQVPDSSLGVTIGNTDLYR